MDERTLRRLWLVAASALVLCTGVCVPLLGSSTAMGVFVGGAWNLVNLWCLVQLLGAWLGAHRSRRRVIGWLVVKFPLFYLLAFGLLRTPGMSIIGFSIGFTIVLAAAITVLALYARRMVAPISHGS